MIIIILWRYKDEQDISHEILITPELVEKVTMQNFFWFVVYVRTRYLSFGGDRDLNVGRNCNRNIYMNNQSFV